MRIILNVITAIILIFTLVFVQVLLQFGGTSPQFPIDCAVVFGAAVGKGSTPGPGITRRTKAAAELYNEKYIKTLILSGGKGSAWQESEASVMRKVAMINGVDPKDILLEENSTSTWENLEFSKQLIDGSKTLLGKGACPAPYSERSEEDWCGVYNCTSYIAISDRYHLARIRFLAYKQDWGQLETYPAQITPSKAFELISTIREALGIIYYSLLIR